MYNSADIMYDSFGIDSVSLSGRAVVIYEAETIEKKQARKCGKRFYLLIAYAGKLYEVMVALLLSYKIPRAGVQSQAACVSPEKAGRGEVSVQP
jgi:hypothetical protein